MATKEQTVRWLELQDKAVHNYIKEMEKEDFSFFGEVIEIGLTREEEKEYYEISEFISKEDFKDGIPTKEDLVKAKLIGILRKTRENHESGMSCNDLFKSLMGNLNKLLDFI